MIRVVKERTDKTENMDFYLTYMPSPSMEMRRDFARNFGDSARLYNGTLHYVLAP